MPIFFKPSASDFSLSADSIGNRWLQEPVVRPNGFPLYHWIQTERGEGLLTLEGQKLLLKPGDGVLIAPHVPHEYRENDGSGMWFTSFLTFDGKLSDDLYKICAVSPYLFVPASEGAWFQEWIDRIIDSHFLKNDIDDAALSVGCFEFLTRLSQLRTGLSRENAAALAALLNRNLTFVAPVDLSPRLLAELCSQISPELVPVISAAAAILQDSTQPHVYLGGEQYLLNWPQLDGKVGSILSLLNDEEQAAALIAPPAEQSESILLGEDLEPQIPGLCIVSDRYLVGGGLWGSVALIGPTRMPFQKLMPLLHTFADQLGEGMSGKRKDTPQAAAPRRTVIYKEDLE
jgi:hypothetical protein